MAIRDEDVSSKEGGGEDEGGVECKVFVTKVTSEEVVKDVANGSDNESSILGDVLPRCWARKDCVAFRAGLGGGVN